MPTRHKRPINVVNWPSIVCVFPPKTFSFFPVPTLGESSVLSPGVPRPLLVSVAGSRPCSLLMRIPDCFPGDHEHLGLFLGIVLTALPTPPPPQFVAQTKARGPYGTVLPNKFTVFSVSVSPHKTQRVLLDTLSSLPRCCSLVANCLRGCRSHTGPECPLSLASPFFSWICSRSVLSNWFSKPCQRESHCL